MKRKNKLALIISSILVICATVGGYVTYKIRLPIEYGEKCTNYNKLGIKFEETNCIKACELNNQKACEFYARINKYRDTKKYLRIIYKYKELLKPSKNEFNYLNRIELYPYSEPDITATLILKKKYSQIKRECEKGSGEACYYLAWDHYRGIELDYDLNKAIDLYKKACDNNYVKACSALAFIYGHDSDYLNDPKNSQVSNQEKALLYKKACTKNDIFSCTYLADRYHEGSIKDWVFANDKLCNFNNIDSCNKLAKYFAKMPDTIYDFPQDLNKARNYAEKACSLGDEISCDDAVNILIKIQNKETRRITNK